MLHTKAKNHTCICIFSNTKPIDRKIRVQFSINWEKYIPFGFCYKIHQQLDYKFIPSANKLGRIGACCCKMQWDFHLIFLHPRNKSPQSPLSKPKTGPVRTWKTWYFCNIHHNVSWMIYYQDSSVLVSMCFNLQAFGGSKILTSFNFCSMLCQIESSRVSTFD